MHLRTAFTAAALALAASLPAAAQSVGVMLDSCASTAQSYFGAPYAQTNMRYNGARVDGTETVGGEIYLQGQAPYIACAFSPRRLRQTEFFVDGRDQSSFLSAGSGGSTGGGGSSAGQTTTEQVRFPAGTSGTELSSNLAPGASHRYVLGAGDGQFLYVRVAPWSGGRLEYQIFNPDGSFLLDLVSARREYRGQLWQSGEHVVEVVNRSNQTVSYNVIFGIE